MSGRVVRIGCLTLAVSGLFAASATGQPVRGPREVVDSRLTTTSPSAPTGTIYSGRYHAAGKPNAYPPYMRKMRAFPPRGYRIDTSVPPRCTASDAQLEIMGPSACPPASRVGGGTADGLWMGRFPSTLRVDVFNNRDEQIFVVGSPGLASISRGRVYRDGSTEFSSPTCFPAVTPPGCPVDNALQLGSKIAIARYTRSVNGRTRSYMTTPPRCPRTRYWRVPIRFWWADGSTDTVVAKQRCRRR